jgi:LysR family transcriptional regulator, glycine cleavage system transcriptional activator
VVDFARHDIDLRISYGSNPYPDLKVITMLQDAVLPMASPAYLARNPQAGKVDLEGVPDDDLIHTNWGPSFVSHPTWQAWFSGESPRNPDETRGFRVGTSSLALDFARDSLGVALGQRMMAAEDLAAGRLVTLSERSVSLGHPYCLVHPHARSRKAGLAELIDFLIR